MKNVHILFGESAAGGLKWALKDSDHAQNMKNFEYEGTLDSMRNYSVRLAKYSSAMDDKA